MQNDRNGAAADEAEVDEVILSKTSGREDRSPRVPDPWAFLSNYGRTRLPLARLSWMEQAACRDWPDDDKWFPPKQDNGERLAEARATCRTCPVRSQCLDYGLRSRQRYGIWGGHTAQELLAIRAHEAGQGVTDRG